MLRYIMRRLLQVVPILFGVSVIVFALVNLTPGNPYASMLSPDLDPSQVESMLRQVGFYEPLPVKYVKWLGRLLRGDMGYSIFYREPVSSVIGGRFGNTAMLASAAMIISLAVGIPAGIVTAVKRRSFFDRFSTVTVFALLSVPTFFLGMVLIKIFGVDLRLLPISGKATVGLPEEGCAYVLDVFRHLILPASVLGLMNAASIMRYARASMLDVIRQDYVRTARAKGVGERFVVLKHELRNALIPVVTVIGLQVGSLLSGALLTETVFVWPGIGRLNFEAVQHRDYPLIMGIVMVLALITLVANLVTDILYALIDPRIRYNAKASL